MSRWTSKSTRPLACHRYATLKKPCIRAVESRYVVLPLFVEMTVRENVSNEAYWCDLNKLNLPDGVWNWYRGLLDEFTLTLVLL